MSNPHDEFVDQFRRAMNETRQKQPTLKLVDAPGNPQDAAKVAMANSVYETAEQWERVVAAAGIIRDKLMREYLELVEGRVSPIRVLDSLGVAAAITANQVLAASLNAVGICSALGMFHGEARKLIGSEKEAK